MPARRRRPEARLGRPTLTRERIARAALRVLGRAGPTELTMRNVAADLQVSPRALYNYVSDRDDLLREVMAICHADRPEPRLDPGRWRESLRQYCLDLRSWHRAHPGLLALAHAENLTHLAAPGLLDADDALVGFFLELGLSPQNAYRAWTITVLQVAGFAEIWDTWHDRPPAGLVPAAVPLVPPLPPTDRPTDRPGVEAARTDESPATEPRVGGSSAEKSNAERLGGGRPDVGGLAAESHPHLRRISEEATAEPPDVLFESVVTMLLAGIEAALLRPARKADAPL
ncbi:TetR/AcrR family transcriptional regulator [Nonomuraea sp. NPDC049269]|uniref:TetR/AcrR family transcriptional regulator n=1 Tax=Nonomuraea sp. NPDC049269 TaxID=3364349 RepID=UPI00372016E4